MNLYATPTALRRALEDRLAALVGKEGGDIQRLRRQAAFDRLLCRLFQDKTSPWLLKGGYAMELRIRAARTTRDIDLALRHFTTTSNEWDVLAVTSMLRRSGAIDLNDGFEFTIGDLPRARGQYAGCSRAGQSSPGPGHRSPVGTAQIPTRNRGTLQNTVCDR